jgi:hypothetical protein
VAVPAHAGRCEGNVIPRVRVLSGVIGLWLLFTRLTLGSTGAMANADHSIGFLILTALSIAAAISAVGCLDNRIVTRLDYAGQG